MSFDSFSGVSARLRDKGVASHEAIDSVLGHLRRRRAGQPIELSDVVSSVVDPDSATRILKAIVDDADEDLLELRRHVRCPTCETLEDANEVREARESGDSLFCTEDGVDLADPEAGAEEEPVFFLLN